MFRVAGRALAVLLCAATASAQEQAFDPDAFERELNSHLQGTGVTVEISPNAQFDFDSLATNSGRPTGTDGTTAAMTNGVSDDVRGAVDTIASATEYIADKLCTLRGRPTKITLHLTAGFTLVFSGETGSQIEWELEDVCKRVQN